MEEGASGGFGALVLHHLADRGLLDGRCAVRTMTLPDSFIAQGSQDEMYDAAGLTARHIEQAVMQALPWESKMAIRPVSQAPSKRRQPSPLMRPENR